MENHTQSDVQSVRQHNVTKRRIVSVSKIPSIPGYEWIKNENVLRHIIFAASVRYNSQGQKLPTNGLDRYGAIIRLGRRILIDLDAFDKWVDAHREEVAHD